MLVIVDDDAFVEMVKLVGGENAARAVKLLIKRPGLDDEALAAKLEVDLKELRKILHRLNDLGLIVYEVHKDRNTGRRIFKWRVQQEQVIGFAKTQMKKVYERLKARLEHEKTHQIYWCNKDGCRKYSFEEAMDLFFKCPNCGSILQLHDNSRLIEALEAKIRELEQSLEITKP